MLQELITNSLKKFTSSATTIEVDKIEQAILLSTLTGKPVYIEGDWWAWKDNVLTKRMVLGVILSATFGFNNVMASTRAYEHYRSIKSELPEQFWYDDVRNASTLLSSIASGLKYAGGNVISFDDNDKPMSTIAMEQLIKELFAQDHV